MIYWQGKLYPLVGHRYNGSVLGYLLDGELMPTPPRQALVRGHILVADGVIVVLRRSYKPLLVGLALLLLALLPTLWPRVVYDYYPVSFAEHPVYSNGVLYCNIYNEAPRAVTIRFLDAASTTMPYTLQAGESLPYVPVDFVPTAIQYNGNYNFDLEVQSE